MKRTINKNIVKRLRTERGWSQEELAIAADLSARTVQRLEAEGGGSTNSIKSIASALEVDMHNLEEKPRTDLIGVRWGYGGVIIGVTCAIAAIAWEWTSGDATAYEVGLSMGMIGLIAGVSCAFIGWASAR
ncbi:MAG: helix-turn-helix transcriptional regulator [Woeseiaceae bacterium]